MIINTFWLDGRLKDLVRWTDFAVCEPNMVSLTVGVSHPDCEVLHKILLMALQGNGPGTENKLTLP